MLSIGHNWNRRGFYLDDYNPRLEETWTRAGTVKFNPGMQCRGLCWMMCNKVISGMSSWPFWAGAFLSLWPKVRQQSRVKGQVWLPVTFMTCWCLKAWNINICTFLCKLVYSVFCHYTSNYLQTYKGANSLIHIFNQNEEIYTYILK